MQRTVVRTLFLVAVGLLPVQVHAQQDPVMQLFRTTWEQGAPEALAAWSGLPEASRSAETLVQVADQLLWTGKHREASALLERAAAEAPGAARVRFQQGRAHLQRAELDAAGEAFGAGLERVDSDTTLSEDERASLRRRLLNRIRFLRRSDELTRRTGPYRTDAGRTLLFKFDPYLNTFPAVVDMETGSRRILYPDERGELHWRSDEGEPVGAVRFPGRPGSGARMILEGRFDTTVARNPGVTAETFRVRSGSMSVEGTLFRPSADGPVPAVVLTHGAGLSTRYNLAHEAVAFADVGIAALVYDKPGLGRSTGANWLTLSIPRQAEIVRRAAEQLDARDDVARIGAWGFSQGGWVAPRAAGLTEAIDFVMLASGAAVTPQEQSLQSTVKRLEAEGYSEAQVDSAVAYSREMWSRVNEGAPLEAFSDLSARASGAGWGAFVQRMRMDFELAWWRDNEVDAGAALRKLDVPVLAAFGSEDAAVPADENVPLMARHLADAATDDYTLAVLPGADHTFLVGDGYHPLYFSTMTAWLRGRTDEATSARGGN